MPTKKGAAHGGLIQGLPVAFSGSRQPAGLSAIDRQRLFDQGHLESADPPAPAPTAAGEQAPLTVIELTPEQPPQPAPPEPRSRRPRPAANDSAPKRAAAPGASRVDKRTREKYRLPDGRAPATTTRSHHFRLPAEIEAHLRQLAEAHGCTHTHIVCAAILDMAERSRRRRPRGTNDTDGSGSPP
jgi:hypothetical protein